MLINQGTWQNPLQWNKFKRTYQDYKFFFKFNILIETNQLGKFQLSKERIKRLKLIYSLHKNGYTNREICDFLNRKKLKTTWVSTDEMLADIFTKPLSYDAFNLHRSSLLVPLQQLLQSRTELRGGVES